MENALYDFCSLVDMDQKTHSFAALTCLFSNTVKPVLSGPHITRTPSFKLTAVQVPFFFSQFTVKKIPVFNGHLY